MTALSLGWDRTEATACDLAVLVNEFPKLSETFVVSDLLALEARAVRVTAIGTARLS